MKEQRVYVRGAHACGCVCIPGRGRGRRTSIHEAGPAQMRVSTLKCNNGLVIYGHGLRRRRKKKKDKPVFSNDKVITFLLFFR